MSNLTSQIEARAKELLRSLYKNIPDDVVNEWYLESQGFYNDIARHTLKLELEARIDELKETDQEMWVIDRRVADLKAQLNQLEQ